LVLAFWNQVQPPLSLPGRCHLGVWQEASSTSEDESRLFCGVVNPKGGERRRKTVSTSLMQSSTVDPRIKPVVAGDSGIPAASPPDDLDNKFVSEDTVRD
jgi:hypothetical protein